MAIFSNQQLIVLFLAGIPVGMFAILFGASQFISLPIFQLLFPQMTLGAVVGNIKVGSALRNLVSLWPLRKQIRLREIWYLMIPLGIGSLIGSISAATLSQSYLLPALVIAIALTEGAPVIARYISPHVFYIAAFLVGIFGGILGAGVSVIILGLLRIRTPEDHRIHEIRVQGVFLEWFTVVISVAGFLLRAQLELPVWLAWSSGSMIGGYIGGILLHKTGTLAPATQKLLLRLFYCIALLVAIIRLIG